MPRQGSSTCEARFYDPATAQFLTVDPAYDNTDARYTYVGDDPLNNVDPAGEWAIFAALLAVPGLGEALLVVAAIVVVAVVVVAIVQHVSDYYASQRVSRNPAWGYVPPPKALPGFPGAQPAKPVTPRKGGGGLRKRWINSDGCILEWDYQHGAVEKFSPNGRQHQGEYDAETGTQTKPGDPTRWVNK
jgi:hypothetical protein